MKRRKTLSVPSAECEECTVPVRKAWTSNLVHSVRVEDEMQVTPLFRLISYTKRCNSMLNSGKLILTADYFSCIIRV